MLKLRDVLADTKPRVHGNGFLQLDVGDRLGHWGENSDVRVHIWDVRLPRQKVDTSIHNHRFGFVSQVILGTLINIDMVVSDAPDFGEIGLYDIYQPVGRNGQDTMLVHVKREKIVRGVRVFPRNTTWLTAGMSYSVLPEDFHVSLHLGTTITLMQKTIVKDFLPNILCLSTQTPDNEFDRNLTSSQLENVQVVINDLVDKYGDLEISL